MGRITKKPAEAGIQDTKNNYVNNNTEYCRRVQVFRKELPLILKRIPLEQRIRLIEQMIPKIEIKQMAVFARQLQEAYIRILTKQRRLPQCDLIG